MVRAHVYISGRVQGVYYRDYALAEARRLGVTGWVRNLRDGRVEAVMEGPVDAVKHMVTWCWDGSAAADVKDVGVTWEEKEEGFSGFARREDA